MDSSKPRGIDGIVLTKFDTIDDKVGAAISMTYISGQPILFVGTGQTYVLFHYTFCLHYIFCFVGTGQTYVGGRGGGGGGDGDCDCDCDGVGTW